MSTSLIQIKDSEVGNSNFPECVCAYRNGSTYLMVEVNTGLSVGSMKAVSLGYRSIEEMRQSYDNSKSMYPILKNYLIYNDRHME